MFVCKAHLFGSAHQIFRHRFGLNAFFHVDDVHNLLQEPFVNHGNFMHFVNRHAAAEGFGDNEQALVINQVDAVMHFFVAQRFQFRHFQMDKADFQRAYCF